MIAPQSHVGALAIICEDCGNLAWQYVTTVSGRHVKGFYCKQSRKKRIGCGKFIELDPSLVRDPKKLAIVQNKPQYIQA